MDFINETDVLSSKRIESICASFQNEIFLAQNWKRKPPLSLKPLCSEVITNLETKNK